MKDNETLLGLVELLAESLHHSGLPVISKHGFTSLLSVQGHLFEVYEDREGVMCNVKTRRCNV